ncbi:hypothetical protein D3C76_578080 [compost metagenome]
MKPVVIAVAAVSGGGKTTITKRLQQKLNRAEALFFDDYRCIPPDDICDWVERGADYNEWDLSPIIHDLQGLLSQDQLNLDYIVLDYPFAYKHHEMGRHIDYTIFIDTPLDIAMARRILRDPNEIYDSMIRNDMSNYLSRAREAYLEMINTIKPDSDYVMDGSLSAEAIVDQIIEKVKG